MAIAKDGTFEHCVIRAAKPDNLGMYECLTSRPITRTAAQSGWTVTMGSKSLLKNLNLQVEIECWVSHLGTREQTFQVLTQLLRDKGIWSIQICAHVHMC